MESDSTNVTSKLPTTNGSLQEDNATTGPQLTKQQQSVTTSKQPTVKAAKSSANSAALKKAAANKDKWVPDFRMRPPRGYMRIPNSDERCSYPKQMIGSLASGSITRFKEVMRRICAPDIEFVSEHDRELLRPFLVESLTVDVCCVPSQNSSAPRTHTDPTAASYLGLKTSLSSTSWCCTWR